MASMDDKSKAKYHYLLQGQALYANGAGSMADIDKALESLENVKDAYITRNSRTKAKHDKWYFN